MLRNISIQKIHDVKTDKSPTHRLVAIDENYSKESKVIVGSLWTRIAQDKDGNDYKFLSGSFQKETTGSDGKSYDGYVLITEKEYRELKSGKFEPKPDLGEVPPSDIDF